jgi:hypothetical protein
MNLSPCLEGWWRRNLSQTEAGLIGFLTRHLQFPVASPALLGQLTQGYVRRKGTVVGECQFSIIGGIGKGAGNW